MLLRTGIAGKGVLQMADELLRIQSQPRGDNTVQGFGMTPEAAKQRISALQGDKDFIGKYLSGNTDAQAEMKKLMGIAYPQEA